MAMQSNTIVAITPMQERNPVNNPYTKMLRSTLDARYGELVLLIRELNKIVSNDPN